MHTTVAPADPDAVPTTDLPNGEAVFAPPAPDGRAAESDAIGPPVVIDPVDIAPETLPPEDQVAKDQVAKDQVAKDQVATDQVEGT